MARINTAREKPGLERIDFLFSQILPRIFLYPGRKVNVQQDVTFAQMKVLWILSVIPECRMTELAKRLSVTLPTATSIVGTLVKKGFVERLGVKDDRRLVAIRLMPKGRSIVDAHKKHRRAQLANIFSKLNQSDQREFLQALERIYAVLGKNDKIKVP